MAQLLILHLIAAAAAPLLAHFLKARSFLVLAVVPGIAFVWLLSVSNAVRDGDLPQQRIDWVPGLGLDLDFRLTTLSWVIALLVTGVGSLVLLYCRWYFSDDDPSLWRFTSVFTAFAGSMLGLVITDNFLVLYVFWEATTIFSYILIGHNPVSSTNRRAAMQALIVTTAGGLAMLVGVIAIGVHHSYSISALLQNPPPLDGVMVAAIVLLLVGALSKSALAPFHFWLPGAMAAPTPVSAYLHAAAMVKAGVYLVALLAPVFAGAPAWHALTLGLGLFTMLVGGWRALRQHDIKLLLAYGTVSQLGFMVAIAGLGTQAAALDALVLVLSHGLFKSTLFLSVGVIDKATGTRDLRELSGLAKPLMPVTIAASLAGLSMAGLAPLLGFVAKEGALEAVAEMAVDGPAETATLYWVALGTLVVGSALTVAYTARFLWGAFARKPAVADTLVTVPHPGFVLAPIVLGVTGLAAGLLVPLLHPYLEPYAATSPGTAPARLALWHGVTLPLALSLVSIAVGLVLFVKRDLVSRAQDRVPAVVDGERAYNRFMRWLDSSAVDATALTQRGSLPHYLAYILLVFVGLPGAVAIVRGGVGEMRPWDAVAQAIVGVVILAAAALALFTRRRLTTVLLVSVTGYGVSVLFVLHGAPDLAITQMLVETVSLVVFVLALRRLPTKFTRHPDSPARIWRLGMGVAMGVAVTAITLVTTAARRHAPVSIEFPTEAYSFGHGQNVVNVTLVDIRAWDTLGEVSVLVAASTGIASLIFVVARNARLSRATLQNLPSAEPRRGTWLHGGRTLRKEKRSVIFEVVTRLVFHVMVAVSLYLLFSGHNQPGGGFAGGLLAGLALVVRYLAGGRYELDEAAPFDAGLVVGLGLLVVVVSAVAPLTFGGTILESAALDLHVWPWGEIHLVTSIFFDMGVYLIVVGMMLDIARSLGTGIDRQIAEEEGDDSTGQGLGTRPETSSRRGAGRRTSTGERSGSGEPATGASAGSEVSAP